MRQHRRAWLKRLFKDDEATGRAVLKATAGPKRKSKDKKEQRVAQRSFDDGAGEAEREEGEVAVVKERYHGVRNAYPRHIRLILLDWLKKHRHHPFITTSDEYRQLRDATSLNNSQIKVRNVILYVLLVRQLFLCLRQKNTCTRLRNTCSPKLAETTICIKQKLQFVFQPNFL